MVSYYFAKASLELHIGLACMMNIGLAVLAAQGKLVID